MNVCPDCNVELKSTEHKYEGKPLYECPDCGDEFI